MFTPLDNDFSDYHLNHFPYIVMRCPHETKSNRTCWCPDHCIQVAIWQPMLKGYPVLPMDSSLLSCDDFPNNTQSTHCTAHITVALGDKHVCLASGTVSIC